MIRQRINDLKDIFEEVSYNALQRDTKIKNILKKVKIRGGWCYNF